MGLLYRFLYRHRKCIELFTRRLQTVEARQPLVQAEVAQRADLIGLLKGPGGWYEGG